MSCAPLSLGREGRNLRLGDIAEITRGYDDPPKNKMRQQRRRGDWFSRRHAKRRQYYSAG